MKLGKSTSAKLLVNTRIDLEKAYSSKVRKRADDYYKLKKITSGPIRLPTISYRGGSMSPVGSDRISNPMSEYSYTNALNENIHLKKRIQVMKERFRTIGLYH